MLDIPTARSLLRETRPRRHADGYPDPVRVRVTALVRDRIADGHTLTAVANDLAVNRGTLQRWLALTPTETAPGFVVVKVDPAGDSPSPGRHDGPSSPPERLVLTSPGGFRLSGMTLDHAIDALRRLS